MIKSNNKITILYLSILFTLLLIPEMVSAQDRTLALQNKLTSLVADVPELEEKTDISVTDITIQEFIAALATSSDINIHIDPSVKERVSGNYTGVKIMDILLFLCKEYNLDVRNTGNIISIVPYKEQVPVKQKTKVREPIIAYNPNNDQVTFDLQNDTLQQVARKITDATGKNVIVSPELGSKRVSGYIKNMEFDNALEKMLYANKLSYTKTDDDFYVIEDIPVEQKNGAPLKSMGGGSRGKLQKSIGEGQLEIIFHSPPFFTVNAKNYPLHELVEILSDTLGISFLIVDDLEGDKNLSISNVEYEEFLNSAFIDGEYGYVNQHGYYLIGKSENNLIKKSKLVTLKQRTVDGIIDFIPPDILGNLSVKEFTEQNGFIVVGNPIQVERFEQFIAEIDKVVPLVLIEILIVEINKSLNVSTGVSAGMGTAPESTQSILPGVDYNLSTSSLNSMMDKINGMGWVNLGSVSPDFYLHIQALEENGKIVIRSTPKLSTLNGHEASMSSGETKYYKEERSNIIGSQNPTLSNSTTWQSINADLSVTIRPIVSGDEQITLEITVNQSQFTPREFPDAPPGSVTREFKSLIRMKNQEMVLLGGLDKVESSTSSRGLPLIARIPVLKHIFGKNSKSKSDSKLSMFIQPTVIY